MRISFASGGAGTIELIRDDGAWKLDRYDDDFLRALMTPYLLQQVKLTASKPGLNDAGAGACVHEWVDDMAPARFRRFADGVLGNREPAAAPMQDAIAGCLADPRSGRGGQSYLRLYLVRDVVSEARDHGYDAHAIACIRRGLRSLTRPRGPRARQARQVGAAAGDPADRRDRHVVRELGLATAVQLHAQAVVREVLGQAARRARGRARRDRCRGPPAARSRHPRRTAAGSGRAASTR